MSTTTETQFVTLREALGTTNAVKRVITRRVGSTNCKTMIKPARGKIIAELLDCNGEWYAGRWAASSETCKRLRHATILVTIEAYQ